MARDTSRHQQPYKFRQNIRFFVTSDFHESKNDDNSEHEKTDVKRDAGQQKQ
jgi:hypothetical protein